ncbi:hypothetical protein AM218_00085 [Hymenobacter sp. DG25A]|nr:hypothetical protein AM218_00085 [Hymenobacter sp. DG25A]
MPAFSQKMGIEEEAVLSVLNNIRSFSFSEISILASKYKMSITQFVSSNEDKLDFRFRSTAENLNQFTADQKVTYIVASLHSLLKKYASPSLIPENWENELTKDTAFVSRLVRYSLLDDDHGRPLLDLALLIAEKLNIFIIVKDIGVDGASAYIDGFAYIIISPRFAPRMLFTLAHELGHLILQHHQSSLFIDYNGVDVFRKKHHNILEKLANDFSTNLLMPEPVFARAIIDFKKEHQIPLDHIGDIDIINASHVFGVSFEAAAMRCEQLRLLPVGSAKSYYEKLLKEFRSPENRGSEVDLIRNKIPIFPNSASVNVLKSTFIAVDKGEISSSKLAAVLGIKLEHLFEIHSRFQDELYY